jgi:hypothetical protein
VLSMQRLRMRLTARGRARQASAQPPPDRRVIIPDQYQDGDERYYVVDMDQLSAD